MYGFHCNIYNTLAKGRDLLNSTFLGWSYLVRRTRFSYRVAISLKGYFRSTWRHRFLNFFLHPHCSKLPNNKRISTNYVSVKTTSFKAIRVYMRSRYIQFISKAYYSGINKNKCLIIFNYRIEQKIKTFIEIMSWPWQASRLRARNCSKVFFFF